VVAVETHRGRAARRLSGRSGVRPGRVGPAAPRPVPARGRGTRDAAGYTLTSAGNVPAASLPTVAPQEASAVDNLPVERPDAESRAAQACRPPAGPGPAGMGQLAQALGLAQQSCADVEKDAYNAFHRYHYASAEAIIAAAKKALAAAGLALLPVEQTLDGF